MNKPEIIELTKDETQAIERALKDAFPNGPQVQFDPKAATRWGSEKLVSVHPDEYPDSMFEFMQALAKAEVNLRDTDIMVRLSPDVKQRFLVVGTLAGMPPIAYLSSDGSEDRDFAELTGKRLDEGRLFEYVGYPYDNDSELKEALEDAKKENPGADFSRIPVK